MQHPSAQGSFEQPQAHHSAPPWQSAGLTAGAPPYQQGAAGTTPWQAVSGAASTTAQQAQAGTAGESATDISWDQGGATSTSGAPGVAPVQQAHHIDHMQPPSQPGPAGQGQAGHHMQEAVQLGHLDSTEKEPGNPFGAADVSEADFWNQHDAGGLSEGPFGTVTEEQADPGMFVTGQDPASNPDTWGVSTDQHGKELPAQTTQSTAEVPARADEPPSTAQNAAAESKIPSQVPPLAEDPQTLQPSAEGQQIHAEQHNTPEDVQPEQHASAGPYAGTSAATPFASEHAQSWQKADSAALQPDCQYSGSMDAQQQAAGSDTAQNGQSYEYWGSAEQASAAQPPQDHPQTHPPMGGQQTTEEPRGHQAWGNVQASSQHDWHAPAASAQYEDHASRQGTAQAAQQLYDSSSVPSHPSAGPAWQLLQPASHQWQDSAQRQQQGAAQHGMPQQGAPFYTPIAPAASASLFQGGQSAWTVQQRRLPSAADEGTLVQIAQPKRLACQQTTACTAIVSKHMCPCWHRGYASLVIDEALHVELCLEQDDGVHCVSGLCRVDTWERCRGDQSDTWQTPMRSCIIWDWGPRCHPEAAPCPWYDVKPILCSATAI